MFNRPTRRRSWKAAAVTAALPLMLASSAAAGTGQQAAGTAADTVAAKTNLARALAPSSQALALRAPVQASCGLLPPKCTLRLDRSTTRRARNAATLASGIATAACDPIDLPVVKRVCTGAIALSVGGLALAASNYYEDGDCLAIDIVPLPTPVATPSRVKHGDHNCS